jgi:dihydroorotase
MWASVDAALEAGELAGKRVMVDFYPNLPDRTYPDMLKRLRPGDIHTHMYAPQFEIIEKGGTVAPFIWEARERGVLFDVGHGGISFVFRNAVPAVKAGHIPETISSDLYTKNIMGPVFSLLEVMNKFLNIGLSLERVLYNVTAAPAKLIGRPELGVLKVGSPADVTLLAMRHEPCSFIDGGDARLDGDKKLECRLTISGGKIVFNPYGLGCIPWEKAPEEYWTKQCQIMY